MLFFSLRLKIFKNNLYIIIPVICFCLWALAALYHTLIIENFVIHPDFRNYYYAGKQIREDPSKIYETYSVLPSFATFFLLPLTFIPLVIADYIWFALNVIFGIIFLFLYNKILFYMNLKKKLNRFIFLMIVSNGWFIYINYYYNQFKYIAVVLLFIVLLREIRFIKERRNKTTKFYVINYGLFVFALGIVPHLIFLLLVYVFYDISYKDFFKKSNIKKYLIVVLMFCGQNFLIFLYPTLILQSFNLFNKHIIEWQANKVPFVYLYDFKLNSIELIQIIVLISTIITLIFCLILILKKNLSIYEKFYYYCFVTLYIYTWAFRFIELNLPLSLILFIPYIKQEEKFYNFVKNNKIVVIGLLSMIGIYFTIGTTSTFTYFKYMPYMQKYPFFIVIYLRYVFFLTIYLISYLFLYFKKDKLQNFN